MKKLITIFGSGGVLLWLLGGYAGWYPMPSVITGFMDRTVDKIARLFEAKPSMPQDAALDMNRGFAAAQEGNWDLAAAFFEAAAQEAPQYPAALFNLALATDSAGGRELMALCRYLDYLAADPAAENAEAVKERIAVLESQVEENMLQLAHTARDIILRFPPDTRISSGKAYPTGDLTVNGETYNLAIVLTRVARALSAAGDLDGAVALIQEKLPDSYKDGAFREAAVMRARMWDMEGAYKTIDLIQDASIREQGGQEAEDHAKNGGCHLYGEGNTPWQKMVNELETDEQELLKNTWNGVTEDVSTRYSHLAPVDLRVFVESLKTEDPIVAVFELNNAVSNKIFRTYQNIRAHKEGKCI